MFTGTGRLVNTTPNIFWPRMGSRVPDRKSPLRSIVWRAQIDQSGDQLVARIALGGKGVPGRRGRGRGGGRAGRRARGRAHGEEPRTCCALNTEQGGEDDDERDGARTMTRAGMRTRTGVSARAGGGGEQGVEEEGERDPCSHPTPHWASAGARRRTMRGTHGELQGIQLEGARRWSAGGAGTGREQHGGGRSRKRGQGRGRGARG